MNNLTLNIYKAFGIKKADSKKTYGVQTHAGYIPFGKFRSKFHKFETRFSSPRATMAHAIKHMMQSDGVGQVLIKHPNEATTKLYYHPDTGNLTLDHATHGTAWGDLEYTTENTNDLLAQRDIEALDAMKHLQRNALISLKSHGNIPMDINTQGLNNLPSELHTSNEARNKSLFPPV